MAMDSSRLNFVVAELRCQGLTVTLYSALDQTWYIGGDNARIGYVATGDELVELKRAKKLNLRGIKALG